MSSRLPEQITVLQRGWLSANNILLADRASATLIDSGYVGHRDQTLALVDHALAGRKLTWLVNTHCHSDHMGGNAAIRTRHACRISLPAGEAALIDRWDDAELLLGIADQRADRFEYDDTFVAGDVLRMGGLDWQVIAAPGHDPHAAMFFAPDARILISGDALWESGFGVVFGALWDNPNALAETRATLEAIEQLAPTIVIPGHGAVFTDVPKALAGAFSRLAYYEGDLGRLARHCVKAIFTYALLDRRAIALAELPAYLERVWLLKDLNDRFLKLAPQAYADWLVSDLEKAGAVRREAGSVVPAIAA